jgi:hypothetical protein
MNFIFTNFIHYLKDKLLAQTTSQVSHKFLSGKINLSLLESAATMVSCRFCVREYYSSGVICRGICFIPVVTMLGTITVLSDGGISTGLMAQGGKVWNDKEN